MPNLDQYRMECAVYFQRLADSAPSLAALSGHIQEASNSFGFRWFTLIRGKSPAKSDRCSFLLTSYPQNWVDQVFEDDRHIDDPLHLAASRTPHGLRWDDLGRYVDLKPRQVETLERARKHGLTSGFTLPLRLDGYPNAMFSVARKRSQAVSVEESLLVRLIGGIAFERAHRLVAGDIQLVAPVHLTSRQLDCIALLAKGYTDAQIGRKLGISSETVREYIGEVRRSYGVKGRFQLALLLARDGYLSVNDIL
ncbi:LuxR family transcriptional regulator [Sphingobium sp.]|uniref:helix-turn-helix transcriptional regulator n=1 Tax=Sphingobium sp. TaxID=1912891 RepID=UPI002579C949|nr:LuxR family transcriptional regulator [Sphingobium sp.]